MGVLLCCLSPAGVVGWESPVLDLDEPPWGWGGLVGALEEFPVRGLVRGRGESLGGKGETLGESLGERGESLGG